VAVASRRKPIAGNGGRDDGHENECPQDSRRHLGVERCPPCRGQIEHRPVPNNLQFMILHVPPHGTSGAQVLSYPAEKGGMVLRNQLVLKVGTEEALLREGDSFLFDSLDPHSFRNPTDEPTQVLWIIGTVRVERHL
jgi:hypothetical protein